MGAGLIDGHWWRELPGSRAMTGRQRLSLWVDHWANNPMARVRGSPKRVGAVKRWLTREAGNRRAGNHTRLGCSSLKTKNVGCILSVATCLSVTPELAIWPEQTVL